MNDNSSIVELVDVSLANPGGREIFSEMNFTLTAGETAVIVGQTGSGKTSLVEMLIGYKRPDSGIVRVFGRNINLSSEGQIGLIRKKIGGVGGIFRTVDHLSVYENCLLPLLLNGEKTSVSRPKVMQILTQFNLLNKKGENAGNLSRGERVLLMLGRALAANQPLLLIDEPLAGLVESTSSMVLKRIQRLAVSGHSLIILTTGQTGLAISGSREYHISDGKLK
nr:ATP-binding cassette domain-containing protein [candidate division Zixibacteria bacterium]